MRTIIHRILTAFFITLSVNVLAQEDLTRIDLNIKKPQEVEMSINGQEQLLISFFSHKEIQVSTLKKDLTISSANVEIPKSFQHYDFMGHTAYDKFCAYYLNGKKNSMHSLSCNLTTHVLQTTELGVIPKEESILTYFTKGDTYFLITVSKVASHMFLYESEKGQAFSRFEFRLTTPNLHKQLTVRDDDVNDKKYSEIGIDKITYDIENNLKSAHSLNKLYILKEEIIFTFDNENETQIILIDLIQKMISEKTIQFSLEKPGKKIYKQGNSFLYYPYIFRLTANDEMMNVSVLDINDVKLYYKFNMYPDQPITEKNSPMISESEGDYNVLGTSAQFFKNIRNGYVSIAANISNGMYVMQIGSYEYKTSYNYGPTMGVGMGMGGMGYGPTTMIGYGYNFPGYYSGYPGYYPSDSYSYIQSTYIYSMIDQNRFEHSDLAPPKTLRERINEYEDQKFKKSVPELIKVKAVNDEQVMMGYYLKNIHQYQLVLINHNNQ